MAKAFLQQKQLPYQEIPVDGNAQARLDLRKKSGQRTVPQIWIGDHHVGGCTDLMALNSRGLLDKVLNS
ncbi:MAG: glutaredoxin 3 [Lentisphaeria bacterium]|jgi:glutaredoxin 3